MHRLTFRRDTIQFHRVHACIQYINYKKDIINHHILYYLKLHIAPCQKVRDMLSSGLQEILYRCPDDNVWNS